MENEWTTTANKTSQLSSTTLNRVVRAMIEQAESIGHASISGFNADCVMCGENFPLNLIDAGHIVPASHGGFAHPSNLLPMCKPCNIDLGDTDPTESFTLHYDRRSLWKGSLPSQTDNVRVRDQRTLWMGR
jgi:hypothetical protein